ncbi:hypothetical protein KW798_02325 [Candidatus Parcubacteria bacterium]|nr:hypothetical protein [Candidatus Parcubacteria bacterium]
MSQAEAILYDSNYGEGVTTIKQVTLTHVSGDRIYIDELTAKNNSITFYWRSSQTKYFFEGGSWFVTGGDAGTGTFPATKVGETQNGLPIFPGVGGSLFIPLSTTHFVVVSGVGEEVKKIALSIISSQKQLSSSNMLIYPSVGVAPLQVSVEPYFMGLGNHWIDFSDNTPRVDAACAEWKPDTDACVKMKTITHTYLTAGVYPVRYVEEELGANGKFEHLVGEENVVVQ